LRQKFLLLNLQACREFLHRRDECGGGSFAQSGMIIAESALIFGEFVNRSASRPHCA